MNYQEIPWTTQLDIPLLALIQCMPVAFALFIFLFRDKSWCFGLGIVFALVELFGVAHLLQVFDSTNQAMQFSEHASLLGLNYHVAVDGMSLLFGLLTAIFTIIILLYGKSRDLGPVWKFQALLFLIEAALFNQLFTLDLLWFTFASTVQIILVGLALSTWSTSPDEDTASTRYLQFMIVAIALLLIGTILIGWNYANSHQGQWSFDLFELSTTPINPAYQSVIFFLPSPMMYCNDLIFFTSLNNPSGSSDAA